MPQSLIGPLRRSGKNFSATLLLVGLLVFSVACGDQYRPVANPIIPPGGDPQNTHVAVVVSSNPTAASVAMRIDVSGDNNIGNEPVGVNPAYVAMAPGPGTIYVLNQGGSQGDSTVTTFAASLATPSINTISLDPNSQPVFVSSSSTFAYVAEKGLNKIAIIPNGFAAVTAFVPVGLSPIAVLGTPDGRKAYSVNAGDNTVSVITTANDSVQSTINLPSVPASATMQTDGLFLYVANTDGTVTMIDTQSDTIWNTLHAGTGPGQVVWDENSKRIYVLDNTSATVSIFDFNVAEIPQSSPPALAKVPVQGSNPIALAVLSDGTKFYVLNAGSDNVTVFDAKSYVLRGTIAAGSNPVSMAASPESTKLYIVNQGTNTTSDIGSIQIIKTLDDSLVLSMQPAQPNPFMVVVQ